LVSVFCNGIAAMAGDDQLSQSHNETKLCECSVAL
jgi:hypothetical protein